MLKKLVSIIDRRLRARDEIFEYSDCPCCVFRVQLATATCDINLADGKCLCAGTRLINLHLWNEHVPPFAREGPTLGWARRICRDFEISLEELARFVASNPALQDVAAVGGKMMFGSTERTQLVANFAKRYGFVHAVDLAPGPSFATRCQDVGENILTSMIVIALNPSAFRIDLLYRNRVPVYLHRAELMRRFGAGEKAASAHQPNGARKLPNLGSAADACK